MKRELFYFTISKAIRDLWINSLTIILCRAELLTCLACPNSSVLLRVSNIYLSTWQHLESLSIYQGAVKLIWTLTGYKCELMTRHRRAGWDLRVILGLLSSGQTPGQRCWWTLVRQWQATHTNWLLCHDRWDKSPLTEGSWLHSHDGKTGTWFFLEHLKYEQQ